MSEKKSVLDEKMFERLEKAEKNGELGKQGKEMLERMRIIKTDKNKERFCN